MVVRDAQASTGSVDDHEDAVGSAAAATTKAAVAAGASDTTTTTTTAAAATTTTEASTASAAGGPVVERGADGRAGPASTAGTAIATGSECGASRTVLVACSGWTTTTTATTTGAVRYAGACRRSADTSGRLHCGHRGDAEPANDAAGCGLRTGEANFAGPTSRPAHAAWTTVDEEGGDRLVSVPARVCQADRAAVWSSRAQQACRASASATRESAADRVADVGILLTEDDKRRCAA